MMWIVELIGLALVLTAAVVQLCLEHFWRERPAQLRSRWVYLLAVLVIAGALANEIGAWQTRAAVREERERIERTAKEHEQLARRERQEISANIQDLVTLARERDPGLTEQEAVRTVTTEVRTLRERTSQLEHELRGFRRYSKVAKYSALGLTGIAGEGLKENSPIARALEGAYIKTEGETQPQYQPRCDDQGLARFENVAREFPDFPFSHWALAICLKKAGNPQWRAHAERAMKIFEHTTRIGERSPHHDQAREQMEQRLAEQ